MDGITNTPTAMPPMPLLGMNGMPNARAAPAAVGKAFEAVFASLLFKQMRQTLEEGSMFPNDQSDVLGGLFDHYLGEHVAESGGLGVGAMIRTQLERHSERTPSA